VQRDYGAALNGFFLVFSESRNSKTDQEIKLIPACATKRQSLETRFGPQILQASGMAML
jgi:hypothetical protein